jgi:hypothetical protein
MVNSPSNKLDPSRPAPVQRWSIGVGLRPRADLISALVAHVMTQPEIRDGKIKSLRDRIARGNYSISEVQLVDALLHDLAEN